MDSAANGPTWMLIALGALTLLQLMAGWSLKRASETIDKLAEQAGRDGVRIDKAEEEIARLRDRRHNDVNREQADMADRELRRLLLEELRALRDERRNAA